MSGRSSGKGPVHAPSQRARHSPSGPIDGENRRILSHDRAHSASATLERQAAMLYVVDVCCCVTSSA